MRGTKRFERRITTPYFKVGTLKRVRGKGSVILKSYAGVPFEYLKIYGVTEQEPPNLAEQYFIGAKLAEDYVSAGVTGAYCMPLPSELVGKKLTYTLNKTGTHNGVLLYLSNGTSALFSTLTPLCDSNGEIYTVTGDNFTHLIFTNVYTSDKEVEEGEVFEVRDGIVDFWQSYELQITAEISPDFDTPVLCMGDNGTKITYNFGSSPKEVSIPRFFVNSGSIIIMRFSKYDSMEIRGREKKVIYKDGSASILLVGTESWQINAEAAEAGAGLFGQCSTKYPFSEGYCRFFKFAPWMPEPSAKNVFSYVDSNVALKLERNDASEAYHTQAINEISALLKKKYVDGTSVQLVVKRITPQEHDISNTTLGQSLLDFCAPYESNGEIVFNGDALKADLEIGYYSSEEGDTACLTVICQNEKGEEISRAEHTLRLGSAYRLSAPVLDGYTPKVNELWGAIKEDKTIIIEYKEK